MIYNLVDNIQKLVDTDRVMVGACSEGADDVDVVRFVMGSWGLALSLSGSLGLADFVAAERPNLASTQA